MNLIKYDAACKALREARNVDEVKDWHDKAAALTAYARQAKNHELEVDAAEIRIRAERRMGELLNAMPKNTGAMGVGSALRAEERTQPPRLADMGISHNLSSRAQQIAAIPEPVFEATLAEHRDEQRAVTGRTMQKLQRQAEEYVPPPVPSRDDQADYDNLISLWNRVSEAAKARFLDAIGRAEWIASPPGTPVPEAAEPRATTWAAFADAYRSRYGVEPVRNATTNSQIANLVKRVGAFDAPHVAAFYVRSNDAFYVRGGHSAGLLLKDCEKLRTEWATNRRMTETQARQMDKTAATGEVFRNLINEVRQ